MVSVDKLFAERRECVRKITRCSVRIKQLDRRISQAVLRERMQDLTIRQQQVLGLVVAGDSSDKEISTRLHVTERTAKFHVSNLLNKFQVRTRRELVELLRAA